MDRRWEPISKKYRVLVSRNHGFGTDALLLAEFAAPRKGERCLEIGSGCGVIPLLWQERTQAQAIVGLELQPQAVELFRESVREAGCEGRVQALEGDAREYRSLFSHGSFHRIVCNPPYFSPGSGPQSPELSRRTARGENTLELSDLASLSAYCLRFGGALSICGRPQRLAEAMGLFRDSRLEPKRLRLVQQRREKEPFLFLLECRLGGRPGLRVEPVLLLEENGEPTPELLKIYGDYRENGKWKN